MTRDEYREYFYQWVDVAGPDDCWLWNGQTTGGVFVYGLANFQGKRTLAHRVAYWIEHGEIPKGVKICHRCDTPLCVNPKHLYAGDTSTNAKDAWARLRKDHLSNRVGNNAPNNRLTLDQVKQIVWMVKENGYTQTEVAKKFGVHQSTVADIMLGRSWKEALAHA